MAKIRNRNNKTDVVVTAVLAGAAPATAANYDAFFTADRAYVIKAVKASWTTASSSGTVTVEKRTGTQAKGAGTAVLSSAISTAGTAETVNTGTLVTTLSTLKLAAGDRLGLKDGGTLTNGANLVVAVTLTPTGF